MKSLILVFLLVFQTNTLHAQNNDCSTDANNKEALVRSYNCDKNVLPVDTRLSYNENTEKLEQLSDNEKRQQSVDKVNAFVKPLNYSRIDERNSDDRYQFNLDNFTVPAYTCVVPEFDDSDAAIKNYNQESIDAIHTALNELHNCLITSDQSNRELFKQFIVRGLDGKILPSEANTIEWTINPKYQKQTNRILQNINQLYKQRYSDYANTHNKLRDLIRRYNSTLPSADE